METQNYLGVQSHHVTDETKLGNDCMRKQALMKTNSAHFSNVLPISIPWIKNWFLSSAAHTLPATRGALLLYTFLIVSMYFFSLLLMIN